MGRGNGPPSPVLEGWEGPDGGKGDHEQDDREGGPSPLWLIADDVVRESREKAPCPACCDPAAEDVDDVAGRRDSMT